MVALLLVVAAGWAVPGVSRAAWHQPVAAPLNFDPAKGAYGPRITAIDGVPYVAWMEAGGAWEIRVARLTASGWRAVGGPLNFNPAMSAEEPVIAGIGRVPYVAWWEFSGGVPQIRVKRFSDGAWQAVGGSLNINPAESAYPTSITSIGGVPYVAFSETNGTTSQVHVKQFTGAEWVSVGGALNEDPAKWASVPSITSIGALPYVAWTEPNDGAIQIHVKQFSNGAWQAVGGSLNVDPAGTAYNPSITTVGGVLYVCWTERVGLRQQIRVARFAGGAWQPVGGSLNVDPGEDAGLPSIVSIGGVPFVAWYEGHGQADQVWVARQTGNGWSAVGGSLNIDPSNRGGHPSITSVGGVPYVAWQEHNGGEGQVRVVRLDPDFVHSSAFTSDTAALLITKVRDYGVRLPVAFEYGLGARLQRQTALQSTTGGGYDTVVAQVGALQPNARYSWRPFATDTFRRTATGPTGTFTTKRKPAPVPLILIAFKADVTRKRVTVRYALTATAGLQLSVKPPRGNSVVVARVNGRMGIGKIAWNRRLRGRRARPGTYKLTITATRGRTRIRSTVTVKLR